MITNATAIICLSKINKINLLKDVYSVVIMPSAVKSEVLVEGREGYLVISDVIKDGWIKVVEPKKILDLGLGNGENHAISLAKEKKDSIILDDALAIKAAKALSIPFARTTTVIFTALQRKAITKRQALAILNDLINNGYYISTRDYAVLISKLK